MSIKITERAIKEVNKVMDEQEMNREEYILRVGIVGGGCSGFSYSLTFEEKSESDDLNDVVYTFGSLEARVDRKSELYLDGTEIDFLEDVNRRGFAFNNPNATKTCGCGSSFSA